MNLLVIVVALVFILPLVRPVNAATIMVNPGQSIQTAVNSANPGDVIQIQAGTYTQTVSVSRSGSLSAPIRIIGYLDEKPVINGNGASDVFDFGSSQYVILSNVRIENGDQLIRIRTSNVTVDNVELFINGSRGVDCRGYNNTIINSYFETDRNSMAQNDGIWSTGGGGHTFSNNYMINRNSNTSAHSDIIQLYLETRGSVIANNYLWQDNTKTTNAQGIYIEDCESGKYDIYNNVVYFPYAKNGVAIRNSQADASIIGNTFYQAYSVSPNLWIRDDGAASVDNIVIKNNIFYSGSANNYSLQIEETLGSGSSADGNLLFAPNRSNPIYYLGAKSLSAWNTLSFVGTDYEADPRFTNPVNRDFHLQSGSPAIDKGVALGAPYNTDRDGKSRPQGSAWDIGAYEYGGTVTTPFPSPTSPPVTPGLATLTPTRTPTGYLSPTPTPATISGDLNGDSHVDIFDYNVLVTNFGRTGSPGFTPADINTDGSVDIFDYNILVGNFGR